MKCMLMPCNIHKCNNLFIECIYKDRFWGIYANSTDEYWSEMRNRSEKYNIEDFIEYFEIWNETTSSWDRLYERLTVNNTLRFR